MAKHIKTISFKGRNTSGDLTKTYISCYEGEVTCINRLTLTKSHFNKNLLTKKFGKALYWETMCFKNSSLDIINQIVTQINN